MNLKDFFGLVFGCFLYGALMGGTGGIIVGCFVFVTSYLKSR